MNALSGLSDDPNFIQFDVLLPQNVNFVAKVDKAVPLLADIATRGRIGGRSLQSLV
ncbi:MAG: hypothetical protein KIT25_20745 [Enhydrobacter sp.]|nr:MAG: hypothetical protein KIT25_20745 [Enhydrobacter sp.]